MNWAAPTNVLSKGTCTLLLAAGLLPVLALLPGSPEPRLTLLLGLPVMLLALALWRPRWRRLTVSRSGRRDALTGLPDRGLFLDLLDWELRHARRNGQSLALLFVDLDRFKPVNDLLGHAAGDELLRQVASRLRECLRESDVVGRLGGDEFVVLLPALGARTDAAKVAADVTAALERPFTIEGSQRELGASIGIAIYPDDAAGAEELVRRADLAMYRAKHSGRGRWTFYTAELNERMRRRQALERDLAHALEHECLELAYQPQFRLRDGAVVAVEALLRWSHPQLGRLEPAECVAAAEAAGLGRQLASWTLRRALADWRRWRDSGVALERVAVNLPAEQLRQSDAADWVAAELARQELPAAHLELELGEQTLLADDPVLQRNLASLAEQGVKLVLHDFGAGCGALAPLRSPALHGLKLDRRLVGGLARDESAWAVSRAAVTLAAELGLSVTALGVERAQQARQLTALGCDLAQGRYYCSPLGAAQLARQLQEAASA